MKIFPLFYNCALHLYGFFSLAKTVGRRKKLFERLGKNFPAVDKGSSKLIWVHAVSYGETKAVLPLIKKLKKHLPEIKILLSTSTETGFQEGKENFPDADWHVYLPFDLPYIIRPIVKKVSPDLVLLTETDFWFHFQQSAKKMGAKLVVLNAKLSERSCRRYRKCPFLIKPLLGAIDYFFLQGPLYKKRFISLGLDPKKMIVTGNLKLDGQKLQENTLSNLILTIGSTHASEEEIWLNALDKIWKNFPDLKVFLAPRHPERFEEVAKILINRKIHFGRYSRQENLENHRLLLIDTMGELLNCYSQSSIAFVGGSFLKKVGGHNIVEPCFFGKPVLFGPCMDSQPDLLDLVKFYDAGVQIHRETLVPTLEKLLKEPEERKRLGENGKKLIASSQGSMKITLNHLLKMLTP